MSILCHKEKFINKLSGWEKNSERVLSKYGFLLSSFENGRSDKEILDNLLKQTRYDKRLLPPVTGQ